MHYQVRLTQGAEQDLEEIYDFLTRHDCTENGDSVLDRLVELTDGLSTLPDRGNYPNELLALGIREYRQALFKPYRLIYRVLGDRVVVFLIADGRRDFQSLPERRLLKS
ncbi:type II toxin-antitoxin system RelE/ParE family toxin [bacterium]|nr:type II toxin-antitoxin system RelE/ParE family toxin [bacterium]